MRSISKRLITKNNVDRFIDGAQKVLYMEADMLLTPGAKDVLRNRGVVIKFGGEPCDKTCFVHKQITTESNTESTAQSTADQIKSQVMHMLKNDYGIKDTRVMTEVLKGVLEKL